MNKINENCGLEDKNKEKKKNNTGNVDTARCWDTLQVKQYKN